MVYSEILLSPGSAEQISFTIKDAQKKPIDFSIGIWSARLSIIRYPGSTLGTYHETTTENQTGGNSQWLSLNNQSQLVMVPDPAVTIGWTFTRYHYDCFLTGPNQNSKPIRIVHGPFIMDL